MEALASLAYGFSVALTPFNLSLAFIGAALGTAIGALPGIGPINAIVLLLPLLLAALLILLVIAFAFTTVSTYLRFRDLEVKYARLARAIALQDAERENHSGTGD